MATSERGDESTVPAKPDAEPIGPPARRRLPAKASANLSPTAGVVKRPPSPAPQPSAAPPAVERRVTAGAVPLNHPAKAISVPVVAKPSVVPGEPVSAKRGKRSAAGESGASASASVVAAAEAAGAAVVAAAARAADGTPPEAPAPAENGPQVAAAAEAVVEAPAPAEAVVEPPAAAVVEPPAEAVVEPPAEAEAAGVAEAAGDVPGEVVSVEAAAEPVAGLPSVPDVEPIAPPPAPDRVPLELGLVPPVIEIVIGDGQPVVDEPTAEYPAVALPPADEPPADQPPAAESPADEPPADQPPAEQPPAAGPPAPPPAAVGPVRRRRVSRRAIVGAVAVSTVVIAATGAVAHVINPDLAMMPPIMRTPKEPKAQGVPAPLLAPAPASPSSSPRPRPRPSTSKAGAVPTPVVPATSVPPPEPTIEMVLIQFEAESAEHSSQPHARPVASASGGQIMGWLGQYDEYLRFRTVTVSTAGPYRLTVYYVSGEVRRMRIRVNGNSIRESGSSVLSFGSTGGWETVGSRTFAVELGAGANIIEFWNVNGSWAPDVDRLTVTR